MKYLYTILAVMILASCTNTEKETTEVETSDKSTAVERTVSDIDDEISNIDENETSNDEDLVDNKVVKLDAPYKNPKVDVDMTIEYTLDSENKIETINVAATTYDLTKFNDAAQVVVGKTIEEAKEATIAGWSLTNEAFKAALK